MPETTYSAQSVPLRVSLGTPRDDAATTPTRFELLDTLRFLAALGILCFHTTHSMAGRIGYTGLPIFIISMVALALLSRQEYSFRVVLAKRSSRFLWPWVFWCLVFSAYFVQHRIRHGQPWLDLFEVWSLLYGPRPAVHLWYLPFGMLCMIGVWGLRKIVARKARIAVPVFVALTAFFTLAPKFLGDPQLPAPISQWWGSLPAVCAGGALGVLHQDRRDSWTMIWGGLLFIFAGLATGAAALFYRQVDWHVPAAIGLVWGTLHFHNVRVPLARHLSGYLLGIYILHPVLNGLLLRSTWLATHDLFRVGLNIVLSLAVTHALRSIPWGRKIL